MAVSLFEDDEVLNEHEVAWKSNDSVKIQELADSFKEKAENELFAIMNDITFNKNQRNLAQSENYNQFWLNNSLSQHIDCIMQAATANCLQLDDQSHYNYLLASVSKGKRFGKWAKAQDDAVDVVFVTRLLMKFHSINNDDAYRYLEMYKAKGHLPAVLKKMKALVTDEFLKDVTKNTKEQKDLKKKALEW